MTKLDTYCGLYCGACVIYHANKNETINTLAKNWNMAPADLHCEGCKSDILSTFCRTCNLKTCAQEKGIESCIECGDYPCQELTAFCDDDAPHHSAIFHNLDLLQANGLEKWLHWQKMRWSCQECNTPFSWYQKKCSSCGAVLYSASKEESSIRAEKK